MHDLSEEKVLELVQESWTLLLPSVVRTLVVQLGKVHAFSLGFILPGDCVE